MTFCTDAARREIWEHPLRSTPAGRPNRPGWHRNDFLRVSHGEHTSVNVSCRYLCGVFLYVQNTPGTGSHYDVMICDISGYFLVFCRVTHAAWPNTIILV